MTYLGVKTHQVKVDKFGFNLSQIQYLYAIIIIFITVLSDADVDEYRAGTIVGMMSILISCACLLYQICRKATTSIGRESMWIIIHCVFSLLSGKFNLIFFHFTLFRSFNACTKYTHTCMPMFALN